MKKASTQLLVLQKKMLSALIWVNANAAKSIPAKYEPNEEEVKNLKEQLKQQAKEEGNEFVI